MSKKRLAVFDNGSNYDYNFIKEEVGEKFKEELDCLKGNTEKYKNFSVPIKKIKNRQNIAYQLNASLG